MRTAFTDLVGVPHPIAGFNRSAADGHEGALRLESFYIGQVVGSFQQIRPAADITRQIVAGCEQRIAELAGLLPPAAAPGAAAPGGQER